MMDLYEEEYHALVTADMRERLIESRDGGEPNPVAFYASPEDGAGRALLAALGLNDLAPGRPTPVFVIPGAKAAGLLDRHVSPGVGSCVMSVPLVPAHAFRLIVVPPGKIDVYYVVFEEGKTLHVGGFHIDLRTRTVAFRTHDGDEGEEFTRVPIDW